MIPYGRHHIDEEDIRAVVEVLRHGNLTQGSEVAVFEQAVASYVGARYAVAVSSGTAALHLACIAAEVQAGDNVVTSPNTFVASANCARYVGASPHFADISRETLNIAPEALAERCARLGAVSAVIPVHFAGLPCDMPTISGIAREYGARIIEDAAHALGAVYPEGGRVGNCAHSDMTVFSFHPVKIIAAGEGGMITTNDERLYHRLLRLRSHGINKADDPLVDPQGAYDNGMLNRWYYEMQELGFNFRITGLQCALATSQMGKIERFIGRRRQLAMVYDEALADLAYLKRTQVTGRNHSAHHLYVVRIDFAGLGISRAQFMSTLMTQDIGSQVHYIPVFMQPYYRRRGCDPAEYPVTCDYYREALSIPLYYDLTDPQQRKVVGWLKKLVQN